MAGFMVKYYASNQYFFGLGGDGCLTKYPLKLILARGGGGACQFICYTLDYTCQDSIKHSKLLLVLCNYTSDSKVVQCHAVYIHELTL